MDINDIEWINQENQVEKKYDIFYKTKVKDIWVSVLHVKNKEVCFVNREKYKLYDSLLRKTDIINCISKNRKNNFKIYSIVKFNYTISPLQIINNDFTDTYLSIFSHIQDINFHDTISYFTDLNELFIILKSSQDHSSITQKSKKLYSKKTRRTNI